MCMILCDGCSFPSVVCVHVCVCINGHTPCNWLCYYIMQVESEDGTQEEGTKEDGTPLYGYTVIVMQSAESIHIL